MEKILGSLLKNLPMCIESSSISLPLSKHEIIEKIHNDAKKDYEKIEITLSVLEKIFETLNLLDTKQLKEEKWQFVSFSAQLFALSFLKSISNNDQFLLPDNFWSQTGASKIMIDQQRELLHKMELNRSENNNKNNAEPIRFIYAAWGFIKMNGKILCIHREDKTRISSKNYVPIGGRFELNDIAGEDENIDKVDLRGIQAANSQIAIESLGITVKREIREETGLISSEFSVKEKLVLDSYRKIEGAKSNHAYTEYYLKIYSVNLTSEGYFRLYESIFASDEYHWFSIDDVINGKTNTGETIYIEALTQNFKSEKALRKWFDQLPDSYSQENNIDSNTKLLGQTPQIDLPLPDQTFIQLGKTGKEKPVDNIKLTEEQKTLLWVLGWYRKNSKFENFKPSDNVLTLSDGWIKIKSDQLRASLQVLTKLLNHHEIPLIEVQRNNYFRLSVNLELIFFDSEFYSYSLEKPEPDQWELVILTGSLKSEIGNIEKGEYRFSISENTAVIIKDIDAVNEGESPVSDVKKLIRDQIDKNTQPLGIRKFIREKEGEFSLSLLLSNV